MTLIHLAANNGEIGGGEVMLLAIAQAVRELGHEVHVLGPRAEDGVVQAATEQGFAATALAEGRRQYMRELRAWDGSRTGVLWCNGLVPALATAGHRHRITHLHQATARVHVAAGRAAALGSLALLVPSRSMARHLPTAQVLPNWVQPVSAAPRRRKEADPIVLGFLGRPSPDKGVILLAQVLHLLDLEEPGRYRLLVAGEPRFVSDEDRAALEAALAPVAHLIDRPGWMERADFFSRVDLAVFPSLQPESFGLTVAEAMSAGVPFVVSDAGALPEVAGEEHPWTARAGSTASLLHAVQQALSADATTRQAVLERARQRWRSRFSPEAGRERVRHLLTDVLPQDLEERA